MIHDNPSKGLIRAADRIVLVDPATPGWQKVVIDEIPPGTPTLLKFLVLEIAVDSTDAATIQEWQDRISQTRS
jgi:hypothetical protein